MRVGTVLVWISYLAYAPCYVIIHVRGSTLYCRISASSIYSAPISMRPSFLQRLHMRRISNCVEHTDHDALFLVNSVHPCQVFSKLFGIIGASLHPLWLKTHLL